MKMKKIKHVEVSLGAYDTNGVFADLLVHYNNQLALFLSIISQSVVLSPDA